jgi:thiol-disulfide isomerase/thioredoxin
MKAGNTIRAGIFAVTAGMIVGTIITVEQSMAQQLSPKTMQLRAEGDFAPLEGATEWLNTRPLTKAELRGKVVLIEFWTYSCINWRRTLPYVQAWAEKYKTQGLVVIGVHSPEFEFEKHLDNVRWALKDMSIGYPVVVDSKLAVWRAFRNDYWPALYFVDAQGTIRHHQFGEGDYDTSERVIQQLLVEAGASAVPNDLALVEPTGAEVAADWEDLKSPENYLGYERTNNFVSRDGMVSDKDHLYAAPSSLRLNHWALSGDWIAGRHSIASAQPHGTISYAFHARDLNLVMGPAHGTPIRFRALIDGQPVSAAAGVDLDDQGNGTVTEQRMYQLIRQTRPIIDHQITIEFLDAGVELYSFTFG